MVSILQLAIYVYCRDLNIGNAEWEFVRKEVLEELGIHEQELPELIDVVLERYNSAV
jgi:hypothetical protein